MSAVQARSLGETVVRSVSLQASTQVWGGYGYVMWSRVEIVRSVSLQASKQVWGGYGYVMWSRVEIVRSVSLQASKQRGLAMGLLGI